MAETGPAKYSFFDKSYKILFVIYAPIAMGTYLYTFFTGARQGFFFLLASAASASFVLGLAILILFLLHRDLMRPVEVERGVLR